MRLVLACLFTFTASHARATTWTVSPTCALSDAVQCFNGGACLPACAGTGGATAVAEIVVPAGDYSVSPLSLSGVAGSRGLLLRGSGGVTITGDLSATAATTSVTLRGVAVTGCVASAGTSLRLENAAVRGCDLVVSGAFSAEHATVIGDLPVNATLDRSVLVGGCTGAFSSLGNNVYAGGSACSFAGSDVASSAFSAEGLPLWGSPAVNAVACGTYTTDVRGVARSNCDIGAYEADSDTRISISSSSMFVAGTTATLDVVVENLGTTTVQGVQLALSLPAAMSMVSALPAAFAATPGVHSFSLDVFISAATAAGTNLDVIASVSQTLADSNVGDNSATLDAVALVQTNVAISIARLPSDSPVGRGAPVLYQLTVTNQNGPSAAVDVSLSDVVPSALERVTRVCLPACIPEEFDVGPDETVTLFVRGNVRHDALAADGPVAYSASVGAANASDPFPFAIDAVTPVSASLVPLVTASPLNPVAGELVEYNVRRSNSGVAISPNVMSTFSLGTDAEVIDEIALTSECDADKNDGDNAPVVITCACTGTCFGAVNQNVTLGTVRLRIPSSRVGGTIDGTLVMSGDYDADGATKSVIVPIRGVSALSVTGGADVASVEAGQSFTASFSVKNMGPSDAPSARFELGLPAGFSVTATGAYACVDAVCTRETPLAAGEEEAATLTITAAVDTATGTQPISVVFRSDNTGATGAVGFDVQVTPAPVAEPPPPPEPEVMMEAPAEPTPTTPSTGCGCRGAGEDVAGLFIALVCYFLRRRSAASA